MTKLELLIEVGKKLPLEVSKKIFAQAQHWDSELLKKLLKYWSEN